MLEPGDKAPKLKGTTQDGSTIKLADYIGKPFVVYFYPKDATPGCTLEAQTFRDFYARFRKKDCAIIGVSRDTEASHAKFRDKHDLPFALVADTDMGGGKRWVVVSGPVGGRLLLARATDESQRAAIGRRAASTLWRTEIGVRCGERAFVWRTRC